MRISIGKGTFQKELLLIECFYTCWLGVKRMTWYEKFLKVIVNYDEMESEECKKARLYALITWFN